MATWSDNRLNSNFPANMALIPLLLHQYCLQLRLNLQNIRQIDIQSLLTKSMFTLKNASLLLITVLLLMRIQCDDQGDWVDPYLLPIESLVHPFYAGYLDIEGNKQYYYVYHPSQSNPSKDPLMVRISAGPGCSSLYSWLYSKGPFIFTPGTDTFRINQHNWNKEANVLFIEGPAGVGFARHTQPINQTQRMDDHLFAMENILSLESFYSKFPELKDQQVYLSGEQYAGVTIPLMAQMIVQKNKDPYTPSWQKINLKGFLVQNPCTLPDECDSHFQFTPYTIQYLYNHYFIATQQYEEYRSKCVLNRTSDSCMSVIYEIEKDFVTTDSDINNIYKQCIKNIGPEKYKCIDMVGILNFLNHDTYKQDLHANTTINWDLCNLDIMQKFVRNAQGSLPIYEKLLQQQRYLRIWIVSGSLSAAIPMVGTRKWMEQLKYKLNLPTLRMWESWEYDDNINAGQVQQFSGITFASVRSAGLSIYLDQPEIGYYLIDSFLKGRKL